ncbi:MAG TPA: GNAT family N-acetyltransferase [Trebonia sp.]|nr:GNAT family N-acetyltransferase [Trebonia sp.]
MVTEENRKLSDDTANEIAEQVARRWRRIDPLLPRPVPQARPHCGAPLDISDDSAVIAAGRCEHWAAAPDSLDLSWGAARRFQLSAAVAGPGVADGLGRLLAAWREHLHSLPGAGDADTAAVLNWPSRDADGIAALLKHGLDPLEVIAARPTRRRASAGPSSATRDGGVLRLDDHTLIRRAGIADTDVIARMGREVIRFDSRFGAVNERPNTLTALRREAAGLVGGPAPWAWLAERDGEAVGMLAAQPPAAAAWIASLTGTAPAAYLMLMFVEPGERAAGVGSALVDEFHREAEAAGVAVILLHYEQLNPLSMPFWSRHGYRPLWTTWQASPASAIR